MKRALREGFMADGNKIVNTLKSSGARVWMVLVLMMMSGGMQGQIISWNFTSGNTPNTNLPGGTTALSYNTGGTVTTSGCTGNGYTIDNWNVNEYFQIIAPTTGYNITTITFTTRSSGTGPRNFKVQYSSTGAGGTFTDLGTTFVSPNGSCSGFSADFTAINALDNNANTVIRLVFTGGEADGSPASGDAASGGTFRIDDLIINGSAAATSSIAISAAHPTAANILLGSTDNIIGGVALAVTTADATLTGITFTTAGGYAAGDIATNGFKVWLSSSATSLSGATQLGAAQAAVASGGTVAVSGLSSSITSGTTRYVLLSANIASGATINNKIRLASTAFSTITFSSGTKTGTDPVAAGVSPTNDQTIVGTAVLLSDNGTQIGSANITENTTNNVLHKFQLAVTTANATLTGVGFTTAGGYDSADITNIKLRYSTDATLDAGDATLSTLASVGAAGAKIFPSFTNQVINAAATGYFFITADVAIGAATGGATISVNAIATGDLTFSSGTKTGSTTAGGTQTIIGPVITLANNGTQVAAANVTQGTAKHLLSSFKIDVATANTTLTSATFITGGNYQSSDASSFKLWYKATDDLSTATQIGTTQASASSGLGEIITFSSLSQTINAGATGYFWVTADIAIAGTVGRAINIDLINNSDLVFTTGVKSGTATAGGPQTIAATSTPTLSTDALTAFGSQCINGTYGPNSFTITGVALTSVDVTVASLSGFTFSTTSGGTYTTSLSLTQPGGAYSQQIFVKFNPITATSYNGNIVIGGGGASNINVAASGSGINTASTITTPTSASIGASTATLGGNITSIGCSDVTERGVFWSTTNGFADGAGTKVSATGTFGTGVFTQAVTGLPTGTAIYFKAFATNAGGTVYTSQATFSTLTPLITLNPTTPTLTGFTYMLGSGPSAEQTFTSSGTNLVSSITIAPSTNYEISTTSGSGFGSSIALVPTSGTVTATTIYVRLKAGLAINNYNSETITSSATGAVNKSATCSGSVTAVAPPNNLCTNAEALTINAAATNGTLAASTFNSPFNKNDVWYKFTPLCSVSHSVIVTGFSGDVDIEMFNQSSNCPSNTTTVGSSAGSTGTETITSNLTAGVTYYVRIIAFNTAAEAAFTIQVTGAIPGTSTTITPTNATTCVGISQTYTATAVTNATSYTWSFPSGWTVDAPSTTNTISVTPSSTTGNVSVTAVNCYGSGIAKTLSSTPSVPPATPGTISGNSPVCEGSASNTYTIVAVSGATSYTWTLPSGWSGTSTTNSITATAGTTGGNITVTANNACGSSSAQTLAVTVSNVTAPAGSISVASSTCGTTTLAYSAPSANLYWQTSASGTSTSNPTTANYVVNTSAAVYVRNFDGTCWSAGNVTFTPTVVVAPVVSVQPTPQSVNTGNTATFTITATGTVSGYQWQVNSGSGFVNVSTGTGGTTATYTTAATTLSMNGYTYQCIVSGTAPCGNITSSSVSLSVANGPCLSDNFDVNYGNWANSNATGSYNNSSAGNTGMGIGFNSTNDAIINTVALLNPASIKFKGSANSSSASNTIKVQKSTSDTGPWTDVSTFTSNGANTGTITDTWFNYDIPLALTGNHFIRIIMSARTSGSFYLDDLDVYCGLPCTPPATPATPTSNSPQCAATGVTISKVGTAPVDEIWYWQTTATGTDIAAVNSAATYTVTGVGTTTIYLRSRNTVTDCWSTASSIAVTVNATTTVTNQPLSANKIVGSTAVFSVTAVGVSLTYQWQVNKGTGWNNVSGTDGTGGTTASFTTVTNTLTMSGYQYRVIVTGNCGNETSNGLATLTVTAAPLCNALLEENFDYGCASSSDLVTLSGTNWNCYSSCSSTFNYSNTGLSYNEYASSGIGGAALMTATADDIRRSFTATTTGSVYVSFLLNLNNGTTTTNDHFIDLGSNVNNLAVRLHSVKINSSTFRLGVSKGQTTSTNTSGALNFGTTYLVVLKYQFVAGTTNDLVSLWAFSSGVPASEAAAGSATVTASDNLTFADAANLQWLVLRQDQARGLIDGLRVATTWSDALCIVPATTAKTYTWTGGGNSTDWTNSCNWSPLGVPTSIDNIIINTSPTSKLNITDSRTVKDFTLNGTGHFNMSNTGILTITGNVTYGGTPTGTLHCDSQVFITNSSTQTIPGLNYGNLDVLGGNRIFPNGGTIGICAGFNVNPAIYSYTVTGSTVNYFSSQTGWTMTPFTYHHLTMSGTGDFSFGYSSPAVNKTVNVLGNFLQTAGTVYLGETSSATATMNIDGNMTITGGTYNVNRDSGGTGIINLKGNLSVAGTLTATSSADTAHLNFLGTTNQTVSGAGTMNIYRSTINKPSGYVDLQRNLEIKRVLTMTNGNIATNANTLTLGESTSNVGTLTYTSGYVIGKMTRWFATGATTGNNGLFPLGTSTNQSRFASINYANVTTSGRLTAEIVNTAMGSIGSITIPVTGGCSAFDPTTGESFYWKLASAGVVGTTYTASFSNQTLTALPLCNLTLLNRNPSTWASTGTHIVATGTTTNYTVSRSGLTTYGDFGVGKKGFCDTTKTWAAGAWTGGDGLAPSMTDAVIFADNYDTATLPNVASCECTINPGVTITIGSGKTLSIDYGLTLSDNVTPTDLADDGKLIIANGGSLLQVTNPTVDGTGNSTTNNSGSIDMERITQPMYRYDYTYWSAPVAGATLHDLSPDTLADKYYWWNPTTGWTISYGGTEVMIPGKGYIVRAPQVAPYGTNPTLPASYHTYTGNLIGVPNNGIVKRNVSSGTGVFNLIGNPYPSAIEADDFITENIANGSIEGTLYFWTHNTPVANLQYTASDYAAYTLGGGVGTKEADSDDDPTDNAPQGQIAAGQAFFVEGGNGTNPAVVFNNEMRVAGLNNQFFKPGPTQPVENWDMTGKHRIWLNLKNAQTGFNQILVGYMENATNDYDLGYDGKSFGGNQVTLYSLNADKNLTIQARALPFSNQDEVPLGYKTTLNGALTIKIDHYDGLFEGQDIYLEDQLLNIVHDLKASAYNFTSEVGTFNNRFVLRYLPSEELSNPDPEHIANGLIVYQNHNEILIKSQLEALEQVTIYDLLGRIVFDKSGIDQNEFATQNVVMNEQPLIVKVKLANGQIVNKKIVY